MNQDNTTNPTGTNTMNQDVNTPEDTRVEHSNIERIESVYDDSNHIVDTLPNHLPNPTEYRSEVAVMFDFLSVVADTWVHTGRVKVLLEMARNELVRGGRSDFYHEVIKELVSLYNVQGGE